MQLPRNRQFLLFDMDGTLVDTEPIGPQNFINQLKRYGVTPSAEERALFLKIWRRDGTAIKQDDWLPQIAQKYGIPRTAAAYLQEFYALYIEAIIAANLLPGVDGFLRRTYASGRYRIAVVTASKRHQVEAILNHHGWHRMFDVIVASEDFTSHKPSPEPYLAALRKLGAQPEEAIVFEDSKNGIRAGTAAGCYVIGLRAGNAKQQDLSMANAVVDSFNDIAMS